MPAFGEKLKVERNRQGITLQQISVSTKIGVRMLQAIEDEQFAQLPGGIFNKGFVRAYARFLGLDEEETVGAYLKASGNDLPIVSAETTLQPSLSGHFPSGHGKSSDGADVGPSAGSCGDDRNGNRRKTIDTDGADAANLERQLPWGIFAALLLATALTLSLWNHFERGHTSTTAPADSLSAVPASSDQRSSDLHSSHVLSEADRNEKATPASVSPAAAHTHTSLTPTAATYIQNSANQSSVNESSLSNSLMGVPEFSVLIQAREKSWITITADGKPVVSELMVAGSERTVRGRKEVTVKAGNSGAMNFELNGKKLASAGESGQVKTITFGPHGII